MNPFDAAPGPVAPAGFLRHTVVNIPALNEAACVADTVAAWLAAGAARVRVVDNGSTDDTAQVARAAGRRFCPSHSAATAPPPGEACRTGHRRSSGYCSAQQMEAIIYHHQR